MSALDLVAAFSAVTDPKKPSMLGAFASDSRCHVGVAAFPAGDRAGFWERHDQGDEILVVLAGRAIFTVHHPDGGAETLEAGPNTVLHLPRGAAHTATILEDIRVFFVTPKDGNVIWTAEQ